MSRHTSNKPSFINKTFWLLVLICSGVVAYGAYVYIQDINESDRLRAIQTDSNSESVQTLGTEEETPVSSTDTEEEAAFERLDDEVELSVKTNLALSIDEASSSGVPKEMTMDISFSSYDQAEQTYSLGIIFANDDTNTISSCSLEIQASPEDTATQTVQTVNQRNASGCRFNNVILDSLPDPSNANPWRIVIVGFDNSHSTVISLERNVSSLANLNNLINN